MKLTAALKAYALEKGWVAAGATDDQIKAALAARMQSGELTAEKFAELSADKAGPTPAETLQGLVTGQKQLADAVTLLVAKLGTTAGAGTGTGGGAGGAGTGTGTGTQTPPNNGGGGGNGNTPTDVEKTVLGLLQRAGLVPAIAGGDGATIPNPTALFSKAAQATWLRQPETVRVKKAVEKYDASKSALHWGKDCKHTALRGARCTAPSMKGPGMGRPLDTVSKADEAVVGAYFRWALSCNSGGETLPKGLRLTDEDMDLVKYAQHELPWTGVVGGDPGMETERGHFIGERKLAELELKALLDDSVSGGITASPLVFDDAIIMTPLLYGELFPLVEVVNLARGRRIEAFTFGTPTFTSGIPEGTAIPLFDTTNFIGALDTVIQNAVGAMEIGLDFEEDSPANIGAMVVARYGEAALQWLDMVVAIGDGVTQPKGIFNTAGVTVVPSANGNAGPLTINDAEGLMFGVNKPFRQSNGGRNVFIGNEVAYKRFRQTPMGTTWANTRVFGMDYGDYQVLGFPFKINSLIPNTQIAFANMAWYRMYRRLGVNVKVETGGKELSLRNVKLIVVRMRYGGQLQLGGAAAIMTNAQT